MTKPPHGAASSPLDDVLGDSLVDRDLDTQAQALIQLLRANEALATGIETLAELHLPDWYVGAGAVVQTVWNALTDRPLSANISDLDLVYFDATDVSKRAEQRVEARANELLGEAYPWRVDAHNQARVHKWYGDRFGREIDPHASTEAAIRTWPTIASCVAVRVRPDRTWSVYAPYGLSDLFTLRVQPNRVLVDQEVYDAKVQRWQSCWPELQVEPW